MENENINLIKNNDSKKETYQLIDIIKFICAIFVVGIHTNIMGNPNETLQWYVLHIVFRIAVPFFFVCSGFFLGKKYFEHKENLKEICVKQIKRLSIPFLFWLLIGLPYKIISIDNENIFFIILKIIKDAIIYPWGTLWFVLATIVAIIIEYNFLKRGKLKYAVILSVFLLIIALLGNSYYFLIEGTPMKGIMDLYLKIFISTRNGIFVGFPFFTAGVYMAKLKDNIAKISSKKLYAFLIIFIIIQIGEVTFIRNKNYIDDHSLFFTTIFVVMILLALCIKYKNLRIRKLDTVLIRNLSTGIYFMHYPIIKYTSYLNILLNIKIGEWQMFFETIIIAILLCLFLYKINNKYINYVIK